MKYDKSLIYCSPNTNENLARDIVTISGFPLTSCLGNYLGVPLIHSRITQATYFHIVDKIQQRLSVWKGQTLSLAGRLAYVQAVMSAIPIYF